MRWLALLLFLLCAQLSMTAQEENDYFLVEFDQFSPPIQDIIKNFEGQKATSFLAPDVDGNEQSLNKYKNKKVIIWFWSIQDNFSLIQLPNLNLLQEKYKTHLQIISFASETKAEILEFKKLNPIDFPVIPKGDFLGEAVYAKDLGMGRLFYLDKMGKINHVIPRQALEGIQDRIFIILENIYNSKGL